MNPQIKLRSPYIGLYTFTCHSSAEHFRNQYLLTSRYRMAVLCRPPLPKPRVLKSLVCSLFPFKEFDCGTVRSLESYDDRNILFKGRPESSYLQAFPKLIHENGFVGKILRRRLVSEGLQELEGQMMALEFAVQRGCVCPNPIRSRSGKLLEEVTAKQLAPEENGMQQDIGGSYYLGIISVIPGVTLRNVKKTPQVLREYGRALGKLNYTLKVCVVKCS